MFFGSYEHNLDDKHRLVIPRKMREELGTKCYIMKGYDGALSLFHESAFQKLVEELEKLPLNKKNARDYLRIQLASTCELEMDKMGRVQLPASLLTKYHIGKEVVIIGMGSHIEVWNKADYEKYEAEAVDKFDDIAENLQEE